MMQSTRTSSVDDLVRMFESSAKNLKGLLKHVEAAPRRASDSSIESIPENSEYEIIVSSPITSADDEEAALLPEVDEACVTIQQQGAHSPATCESSGTLPAATHVRHTSSSGDVADEPGFKYAAGKNNTDELTVVYCHDIESNFGVPSAAAPRQPSGRLSRIASGIVAVGGIAACMLLWNNGKVVAKSPSSTNKTDMNQSFSGRGALKVKNKRPAELPTWTGTADMAHALKTNNKSTSPVPTWTGTAMGHGLLHS